MASPTFFSDGHTPAITDTTRIATEKILGALIDGGGGGGGGSGPGSGGVFTGHYAGGSPTQTPNPNTSGATAYDLDAPFTEWKWNPDTLAWE